MRFCFRQSNWRIGNFVTCFVVGRVDSQQPPTIRDVKKKKEKFSSSGGGGMRWTIFEIRRLAGTRRRIHHESTLYREPLSCAITHMLRLCRYTKWSSWKDAIWIYDDECWGDDAGNAPQSRVAIDRPISKCVYNWFTLLLLPGFIADGRPQVNLLASVQNTPVGAEENAQTRFLQDLDVVIVGISHGPTGAVTTRLLAVRPVD